MLDKGFDKIIISVYTKEKKDNIFYDKIRLVFKNYLEPIEVFEKEFPTFNKMVFNESTNRFCIFFDGIEEFDYGNYIRVFVVKKLNKES